MKRLGLGLIAIGGVVVICIPSSLPKFSLLAIALFLGAVAIITLGFTLVYRRPSIPPSAE